LIAFGVSAWAWAAMAQPHGITTLPGHVGHAGVLVFYSDSNFRGRTFDVTGPSPDLRIPFRVRSYRAAPGESWQVCANTDFRSPCSQIDGARNDRGLLTFVDIRSARPLRTGGGPGHEFSGSGFAGPSLQGMASEFFRAPEDRGARIVACRSQAANAACAADTAARFCRARGYAGGSAFQRLETVRGQTYLADVLCTRAGG
jgi:hypothetical protein